MRLVYDQDIVSSANQWLIEHVSKHDAKSILIPVGGTMRPIFAAWRKDPPEALTGLRRLQLDEIIGGPKAGIFARTLAQELPNLPVDLPFCFIPSDLAILGLGTNGHVAFHEPGIPLDFRHGEVSLTAHTAQTLGVRVGTPVVTYGVGALMETKAILLIVTGTRKREILKRCFAGEDLPAAALMKHEDITVLTDLSL